MKSFKIDNLYTLIHTMTPTEKRFFKRFLKSRKQEDNDYLCLFDTINSMDAFNKDELFQRISKFKFHRHVEVKKHHLFQLILDSLRQFRNNRLNLHNAFVEIDILIEKGLYHLALKRIKISIETASLNDQFTLIFQLLEKELLLARFIPTINVRSILKDQQQCLIKSQNLLEYLNLFNDLKQIIQENSFVRNLIQLNKFKRFSKNKLLLHVTEAKSLSAQLYYHHANHLYNATIGEKTNCWKSAKKMHQLIRNHPENTGSFCRLYLRSVTARFSSLILNGYDRKEFTELVNELKGKIYYITDPENAKIAQAILYEFQLIAFLKAMEYEKALSIVKSIKEFLKNNKVLADGNAIKYLRFDVAKTFFITSNYMEAKRWFLKIDIVGAQSSGNDIYAFSRILSLLCDIFLNETENVRYNANYLRKQLSKLKALHDFESFLMSRISNRFIHWHLLNKAQKKRLLEEFRTEVTQQLSNKWKANTILYFDFEWWIDLQLRQLDSARNIF